MTNESNNTELIPFCTHKDILTLKGEYIKALGIVTAEATKINYEYIKHLGGLDEDSKLRNFEYVSYKKIDRVDMNISHLSAKYNISPSTMKNMLRRLSHISDIGKSTKRLPPLLVFKGDKGPSYWINHKIYEKYYTLIRRDVLEKLLVLPANALKLYLVIKYNYELAIKNNKPCIMDMKYLCRSIGLSENSRNRISPVLFEMDNKFIKIKTENNHKLIYNNGKLINAIRTEYTYEIIN